MNSPVSTRSPAKGRAAACALAAALALVGCKTTAPKEKKAAETQAATRPTAGAVARQAKLDEQHFRADLQALTANTHRLAGRADGSLAAADYVQRRLEDMGFRPDPDAKEALFVQEMAVVQPRTTSCELIEMSRRQGQWAEGRRHQILPMRPNLLQASVTSAEGIVGRTLYVGSGTTPEYGRRVAKDRIVVLDFDCRANWLNAFAFGASAVLFLGQDVTGENGLDWQGPPAQLPYHHVGVPANLPRFYVPKKLADELRLRERPRQIKLVASCRWEELRGRNVIGLLRGTDAKFPGDRPPQAIVLAAPLDSYSEVPALSPGARDAGNCAALLQIAQHLKDNRPRRDVAICFLDGQALNHMGARAFYAALFRKVDSDAMTLEKRLAMFRAEREYMEFARMILSRRAVFNKPTAEELAAYLRQADPDARARLEGKLDDIQRYHSDVVLWLRQEARIKGSEILDQLRPLRLKLNDLRSSPTADTPATQARIKELERLRDELAVEDLSWNSIQRVIHHEVDTTDEAAVRELFEDVDDPDARERLVEITPRRFEALLDIARKLARRRIAELDQAIKENRQATALRDAIGQDQRQIVLHASVNFGDAGRRWTFVHGDDSMPLYQDSLGNYTAIFKTMRQVHEQLGPPLTVDDVADWQGLCRAMEDDGERGRSHLGRRLWDLLPDKARGVVAKIAEGRAFEDDKARAEAREEAVKALNGKGLASRTLYKTVVCSLASGCDERAYRRAFCTVLAACREQDASHGGRALWKLLAKPEGVHQTVLSLAVRTTTAPAADAKALPWKALVEAIEEAVQRKEDEKATVAAARSYYRGPFFRQVFCTALAAQADRGGDHPAGRLWQRLSQDARRAVGEIAAGRDSGRDSWLAVASAVADVLSAPGFYNDGDLARARCVDFDGDPLAEAAERLWVQDLQRINRLVAEALYPGCIAPTPPWRVVGDFDDRGVSQTYEGRLFAPGQFADSSAVARMFAVFNVSMMTVMDAFPRHGQPADTRARLKWKRLFAQAQQAAPFIEALANHNGLNISSPIRPDARYAETQWSGAQITGSSVRRVGTGSALRAHPERDAIVAIVNRLRWRGTAPQETPPGFVPAILLRTNVNGNYEVIPFCFQHQRNGFLLAAKFDRPAEDEAGGSGQSRGLLRAITAVGKGTETLWRNSPIKAAIMLFRAKPKTVVGYGYSRGALGTKTMRALSTANFQPDRYLVAEHENVLAVFAPYDANGVKLFNKLGMVLLRNANTKTKYQGVGISLKDPFEHPVTGVRTAHDLRVLNEYRLGLLRDNRINQESLEILNNRAKELEQRTEKAMAEGGEGASTDQYFGTLAAAAAISRGIYPPLVGVLNDLVTAVVLLLLLAVPFAYSLERLLIGSPHIYRQIGWFTVFFLLTFGLLYSVNPAFNLAATPVIIFLAFAIIVLSSLVIFIMVRKLQTEIRKVQGLATTVHSTDVSRLSTMMAAVNMGVSTMRRRPLRTLLTAITVVLLTFTILTFASFGSSWGNRRTYKGPMSGPPRILVRHMLWSPISEELHKMLRGHLSGRAEVVPRYWVSPTAQEAQNAMKSGEGLEMLVTSSDTRFLTPVAAAIGLDRRDVDRQPLVKQLFDPAARVDLLGTADIEKGGAADTPQRSGAVEPIYLTDAVRRELHLDDEDVGKAQVVFHGLRFVYAGIVTDALAGYSLLEESSMLPVDYQASGGGSLDTFTQQEASESLSEIPDIESAQFVYYNVDRVVIISPTAARRLRGRVRALTVYPHEDQAAGIQEMADRVATVTELPTYVGDAGGVYRLIFTSLAEASGWRDLLIPVILGGLIVFATMLGSVSDREREIYTFSSLGLAPPHVASLFFAEASVYAVLGGMGGYLLGQLVARLLSWLSGVWDFPVPRMNYSSTNAIVTILIVMSTVLISTIYPALKASRSANPGIQRSWKIPAPKANLYDLVFPFTVSAYDITGVVSFLKEHFNNYSDTSLGVFATTASHIFREQDSDMLGIEATVALAPFDLGVNQRFALLSQPSDIEGIDEVRILIYRLSGANGDWRRSNRVFINDLRKQLLIWRSLPPEIMEKYRQMTLEQWDELPRERVDADTIGETA